MRGRVQRRAEDGVRASVRSRATSWYCKTRATLHAFCLNVANAPLDASGDSVEAQNAKCNLQNDDAKKCKTKNKCKMDTLNPKTPILRHLMHFLKLMKHLCGNRKVGATGP